MLSLDDLFFYGILAVTPSVPTAVFGLADVRSQGCVVVTILAAMATMILTAVSLGRLASVYHSTGSAVKTRSLFRRWRGRPEATTFLKGLLPFRERLRDAVERIEGGSTPSDEFIRELNSRLLEYPPHAALRKHTGRVVRETLFRPRKPADLWAPIIHGAADLLTESDASRLRQCKSCVVHFYNTSRKSSRRWCSMNICCNIIKVAAYQHRKRSGNLK